MRTHAHAHAQTCTHTHMHMHMHIHMLVGKVISINQECAGIVVVAKEVF